MPRLRVRDLPPQWTLLGAFIFGLCVALLSRALHLDQLRTNYGGYAYRQVGYLAALNWSVGYTFLFPIAAFLMLSALHCVPSALRSLADRGMIRSRTDSTILPADELITRWLKHSRAARVLMTAGMVAGLAVALGDWAANNLMPLISGHLAGSVPEVDWGLAAAIPAQSLQDAQVPQFAHFAWLNAAFDLLCFSMEGVLIASVWSFFVMMTDLPSLLMPEDDASYIIVPQLTESDKRRGFELFEELLSNVLMAGLTVFVMLFLSRLQKLYMRADPEAMQTSIGRFVRDDAIRGLTEGIKGIFGQSTDSNSVSRLLQVDSSTHLHTAVGDLLVLVGMFLLLVFVFLLILWTIRTAAQRAQTTAENRLPQLAGALRIDAAAAETAVQEMQTWPLRYPSVSVLIGLIFFASASLVFYHLGIITIVAVGAAYLGRIGKSLASTQNARAVSSGV